MIYALDTNILSYMLRGDRCVGERYLLESNEGHECVIPPIAYYEIRRGLLAVNATAKLRNFDELCFEFKVGDMNFHIWNEAAKIYAAGRQMGRVIEDADIFIAAFCIANRYTLVTNNTKHFEGIENLLLTNWV